jgi:hypothetical protein
MLIFMVVSYAAPGRGTVGSIRHSTNSHSGQLKVNHRLLEFADTVPVH